MKTSRQKIMDKKNPQCTRKHEIEICTDLEGPTPNLKLTEELKGLESQTWMKSSQLDANTIQNKVLQLRWGGIATFLDIFHDCFASPYTNKPADKRVDWSKGKWAKPEDWTIFHSL